MPSFLNFIAKEDSKAMNSSIFNVNEITSKTNSTIVKIGKLSNRKNRYEEKLFLCHGIKLFLEAVKFGAVFKFVILKNDAMFDDEIIKNIKELQLKGVNVLCVSSQVFEKLTDELSPQGIISVCAFFDEKHSFSNTVNDSVSNEKIMIFESIRDPGNVGTIIRNAAAFGIDRLIFSSDCADIYSPKVIRATMGALFKVKIDVVENLKNTVLHLKKNEINILGAALKAQSLVLGKYKLSTQDAVIIGNEGHGISDEILELCDNTLFIPMSENTESLNAAIATAIIMWEISK